MGNEAVKDILAQYDAQKDHYEAFAKSIADLLDRLIKFNDIDILPIEFRTKDRNSLSAKIVRPDKIGKYSKLSDITDISGVRVIAFLAEDCEEICKILEDNFSIDVANSINKEDELDPDRFGYLSRHYVLGHNESRINLPELCEFEGMQSEIQVRTVLQHSWAAIDWKLRYKSPAEVPAALRRRLYRISALLETADSEFSSIAREADDIREFYKRELSANNYHIPIDAESMQIYLQTNARLEKLFKRAARSGLDVVKIDFETHGRLAFLIYSLRAGDHYLISDVDGLIKKNHAKHIENLKLLFSVWDRNGLALSLETMIRVLFVMNSDVDVAEEMIDASPISINLGTALREIVNRTAATASWTLHHVEVFAPPRRSERGREDPLPPPRPASAGGGVVNPPPSGEVARRGCAP